MFTPFHPLERVPANASSTKRIPTFDANWQIKDDPRDTYENQYRCYHLEQRLEGSLLYITS